MHIKGECQAFLEIKCYDLEPLKVMVSFASDHVGYLAQNIYRPPTQPIMSHCLYKLYLKNNLEKKYGHKLGSNPDLWIPSPRC